VDPLVLAAAAGRLFQAVTPETVQQMTNSEVRAWLAFTDALGVRRYDVPQSVEVGTGLDPIRYID
jgi:soluble P-type ATPase